MKTILLTLLALGVIAPSRASDLNLMPWPSGIQQSSGVLRIDQSPKFTVKCSDRRVRSAVSRFSDQLRLRTGALLPTTAKPDGPVFLIQCTAPGAPIQHLEEDESYQLIIEPDRFELSAPNPLGVLHGLQTALQLIRADNQGWVLPAVRIDDVPRFPWRGLMIDSSRHFIPMDVLKRNIDGMAAVKLNVLHLHLSDDEGFRVESKTRPRLHTVSSHGQYYKQSEIRNLVAYARDRGIRIVPEFDMPGHSVSWILAYPELSSAGPVTRLVQDMTDKVRPVMDPTKESTYKTIDAVFGEMTRLFPDKYFHIGGDEVDGKYWDQNEKIQLWMKKHHIQDNRALQAYFTKRVQKIVTKYKKRTAGWDEILGADLPKDIMVHSWRGPESLAQAAKAGYQTMLSAGWYLDLMYPTSQHYAVEPFSGDSSNLTDDQKKLVVGGEACQWTEFVTSEILDNRLWPRLGAIAERLWSPASITDVNNMYARLTILNSNLEWLDLRQRTNSRRMLDRLAGNTPIEFIDTLASGVEPLKGYERGKTESYNTAVPLNRLVDAIPPESEMARRFNLLAQQAIQDPSLRIQLRKWLIRYRDNDAQLQPFFSSSHYISELAPLSHNLLVLGDLGLEALDNIDAHRGVSTEKRDQQIAAITDSTQRHAEVQVMIGPGLRALVDAQPGAQ